LVTGATGQQGGAVARILLDRGHHVRALTRRPDAPAAVSLRKAGAEVVPGDLGDGASVERAAKGIDAAFLVATPFEKGVETETRFGVTALDAFRTAGVPYIVYSSVSDADRKTGIPHFDSKAKVEEHLRGLGVAHSIVGPVFFMENLRAPWMSAGYANRVVAMGIPGDRKLQVIALSDLAEFMALAIEKPDAFRGKRTNIASDDLTPAEMTRTISQVSGTALTYQAIPIEQVRQWSTDMAAMYDWFNRVGYSADIPRLKRECPEVRWRSFADWASVQDWARVLAPAPKA
jgi:uncharacterized protein YbjT (DUF2867 family)